MAPLILGGGAVATGFAVKEKTIGETVSDSQISMNVKSKFYTFDTDMHARINVNVQNGEVLLTGIITDQSWKDTAEKLAWEVQGVIEVHNYIDVTEEGEGLGDLTSDGWITTKAKSQLMGMSDVHSLNYNIKTVNQVIYVMGIAQDQQELEHVTTALGNLSGVKKIVSLVHIKDEPKGKAANQPIDKQKADEHQGG